MTFIPELLETMVPGSILTALAIILVRLLFRRILSPKAKYYLWLLLAVRLVLPVLPESPTSLMNFLPEPAPVYETLTAPTGVSEFAAPSEDIAVDTVPELYQQPLVEIPSEAAVSPTPSRESILTYIYLAGVAAVLAVYLVLYLLTARSLRRLPRCADKETLAEFFTLKANLGVKTKPDLALGSGGMSGGLIRPTIVIPPDQSPEELRPILVHELLHIRAGDLWLMALYRLLCALNWFNPVVWLCFHQAKKDSEAACDQRVLESGMVKKESYAQKLYQESLMNLSHKPYVRTTFGGPSHSLRNRMRQIARFSGKKAWVVPLVLVLALVITACTLTAASTDPASAPAPEPAEAVSEAPEVLPVETEFSEVTPTALYSPYSLSNDEIIFESIPWDTVYSDVANRTATTAALTPSTSQQGFPMLSGTIPGHPEVSDMEIRSKFSTVYLANVLYQVEINYDLDHTDFDAVVADRTSVLGEPDYLDTEKAFWEKGNTELMILNNKSYVRERLMGASLQMDMTQHPTENIENLLLSLNPPVGRYGWSFQEHVDAGMLDPKDGTTSGDETIFVFTSTIELGGYPLPVGYYFTETYVNRGSGTLVLTEIHVEPPEGVSLNAWLDSFEALWQDKMFAYSDQYWCCPVFVGSLLSNTQTQIITDSMNADGQVAATQEEAQEYLDTWYLASNFYDPARGWVFNGTGAALYRTATGQ